MAPESTVEETPVTGTDATPSIDGAEHEADAQAADAALEQEGDQAQAPAEDPAAPAAAPATESHEVPIHRATCTTPGCDVGVVYRPTASGHGIQVLERFGVAIDTAFGLGPTGIPVCPHGHGELGLADDLLSAPDAITETQRRVSARDQRPPRLPFPTPPFNHAGALHAIQEKRHEVKDLEREFERKDAARKQAKAALDEANTQLGQMIDEFEERELERDAELARREQRAAEGHPEDTTLVRCLYERQHEGQTCPLCAGAVTFVRGEPIAPKAHDRHLDQVAAVQEDAAFERLIESLSEVADVVVTHTRAKGWTLDQRAEVQAYLEQLATSTRSVQCPSVFTGMHLAGAVEAGAAVQCCKACGTTLLVFGDADVETDPYPAGTLVGADCPGTQIDGHRYPTRARKTATPAPKPAKAKRAPKGKGRKGK